MTKRTMVLLAACAAASVAGCAGQPCDSDETFLPVGICLENDLIQTDAGAGGGLGEGGASPPDAGESACAPYDSPCSVTEDCGCETNACVLRTEDADGICTHTGCVAHPEICPEDWQCVDLSPYGPELPSLCLPSD